MHRYLLFLLIISTSCNPNPLDDEYAVFQGTWQWKTSTIRRDAFTVDQLTPARTQFEASIVFDDKGHVQFLKDDNMVGEYDFRIVEKDEIAGRLEIIIKLKGNIGDLDLEDKKVSLSSESDTAITINNYPFPAIDEASSYRQDFHAVSSLFVK